MSRLLENTVQVVGGAEEIEARLTNSLSGCYIIMNDLRDVTQKHTHKDRYNLDVQGQLFRGEFTSNALTRDFTH